MTIEDFEKILLEAHTNCKNLFNFREYDITKDELKFLLREMKTQESISKAREKFPL